MLTEPEGFLMLHFHHSLNYLTCQSPQPIIEEEENQKTWIEIEVILPIQLPHDSASAASLSS